MGRGGQPAEHAGAPMAAVQPEAADLAAWLAVAAGALGAFMATLDISIVNASLPTIQGEIGASPSEGTWIGTSYLVAEIVVTPITAWLSRMLGLRRFMLIATVLFTAFSVMCGLSGDLTTMIVGRTGQGLAGGTLVPTALTIIATRLPARQQPVGIAIFGGTMLLGPLTGPLLGGWITEAISWRYAFFINVPVGIGLVSLLIFSLPKVAPDWSDLRNADWLGLFGMTLGLGCLTVMLEEGHREQWFESGFIIRLALLSGAGFIAVAWTQFHNPRPIIRLALLRVPAFSACVAMMLMFGALLFGLSYVVPQFLAAIPGYNAFQAGQVVFMPGLSSVMMMLAFPFIVKLLDPRTAVVLGCLIAGISAYLLTGMTAQSVGSAFILPQVLFGGGAAVATLTLQQSSIIAVPLKYADEASAIFMAARNLGGSIGLAMIASFQEQRIDVHRWQIHASISANDIAVQQAMTDNAAMLGGGPEGMAGAYRMLDGQVRLDSLVMSFNDIFLMLALGAVIIAPLALLLRGDRSGSAAVMH
ncbi:Colistin resistance protein EmrB [Novosphingobium sp. CECT 9465]|nr:Colistin resistance protein EmrB [Novosphingobium sp. CECT 9465]